MLSVCYESWHHCVHAPFDRTGVRSPRQRAFVNPVVNSVTRCYSELGMRVPVVDKVNHLAVAFGYLVNEYDLFDLTDMENNEWKCSKDDMKNDLKIFRNMTAQHKHIFGESAGTSNIPTLISVLCYLTQDAAENNNWVVQFAFPVPDKNDKYTKLFGAYSTRDNRYGQWLRGFPLFEVNDDDCMKCGVLLDLVQAIELLCFGIVLSPPHFFDLNGDQLMVRLTDQDYKNIDRVVRDKYSQESTFFLMYGAFQGDGGSQSEEKSFCRMIIRPQDSPLSPQKKTQTPQVQGVGNDVGRLQVHGTFLFQARGVGHGSW